ncbi:MAG: hydrogen gas-evolving membrane-bound hydrogenase subunit E, partial [Acidobacteriaceae bacterium]
MTPRARTVLFLIAAMGLAALFAWGLRDLPPLGDYRGPYGDVISGLAVYERHATDVVNAITYDYRGFDTLGEEYILYASVLGVLLLFRKQPSTEEDEKKRKESYLEDQIPVSDTVRVTMQAMVAVMVVLGIYVATHGQLTPGGGFQGGVILATAPLLVYLSGRIDKFQRIVSHPGLKLLEAMGAAAYALIGLAALVVGANFLTNYIPLGQTGSIFSSGTIASISFAVSLEVTGGFVLLMQAYLEEIL